MNGDIYQKGNSSKIDIPIYSNINNLIAYAYYSELCNPLIYSTDPNINYNAPPTLNKYYPNPTITEEIKLNIYQKGKMWSTIYDICGRKIREYEFSADERFKTIQIHVGDLEPAIYLIETKTSDCYLIDKVFVK